ncbi:carbohydrate ABC transporter permease [Nonomuraea sp. NPDC050790]|uniref:carbohydrate ABC transporter permease n=1 Tax=Nonomuraea sp. NPDC050790 TaxID=3364371 RepID=UPI0037A14744
MRHRRLPFIAGFLVLPLTLYAVLVLSPYAQAFYLALTDWRGVSARAEFVGAANFARLLQDPQVLAALKNNAIMLLVVPVVTVVLALFLAAALSLGRRRGARIYRVVYFFPQLLSVAVVGVLFQFVFTPNSGLLNGVLNLFGIEGRSWLGDPSLALWAVMAVVVWSAAGFYVVLFCAAMESIPREILEAAAIDGASALTRLTRVVLPLVWENVQVAFIYLGMAALDGFAIVQIMTVGPGGPDNATEVLGLTLYRNAFTYGKFGYASALGVALFFLTLALAVLVLRGSRRERVEMA